MNFASDNTAGAAPEVWAALAQANAGHQPSYGADEWTRRATAAICRVFEREAAVFPVMSGTAANCLSLATLVPRYGAVLAENDAHILAHESTAPEFFTGARFIGVDGRHGKILPEALGRCLAAFTPGDVHVPQPAVLSLTQPTEVGTVYTPSEIRMLSEIAHRHGMTVHMDGARFANAVVALGVSPADMTWRAGVDVLSLGLTKNGALAAEAAVFFSPAQSERFAFDRKRGGHLLSKMRFVSAQIAAMLEEGLWLDLAGHSNAMARRLAEGLSRCKDIMFDIPVETNSVFPECPTALVSLMEAQGVRFYPWGPPNAPDRQRIRLVCSFSTTTAETDRLIDLCLGFARR